MEGGRLRHEAQTLVDVDEDEVIRAAVISQKLMRLWSEAAVRSEGQLSVYCPPCPPCPPCHTIWTLTNSEAKAGFVLTMFHIFMISEESSLSGTDF